MQAVVQSLIAAIVDAAGVPENSLERLWDETDGSERDFVARVAELGLMRESDVFRLYAESMGLPFENPDVLDLEPEILDLLPEDVVRRYRCLPVRYDDDTLVVAMEDPLDLLALDTIQEILNVPVMPCLCPPETLRGGIEYKLRAGRGLDGLLQGLDLSQMDDSAFSSPQKLKEIAGENAIVQLVDWIIDQALRRKASDIHIEPGKAWLRLRLRIDGRLETVQKLPKPLHSAIISRIKILSVLDISERRRPQDGRFAKELTVGGAVEFRVSTLPSVDGEKAVLRILDKRNIQLDLDKLGFAKRDAHLLRSAANRPNGLILVTGPTGSGKTTTLYGVLDFLNTEDRNLITVEDPVEYHLAGVTQVQVDRKADRTFATALRSMMRQDPDVVMVGEIRDHETAEIAIHAALTGHMVLSTLHTNSSIGTITRLRDMHIASYLLAPTVRAIVAQRLVRRLCDACAEPHELPQRAIDELELEHTEPSNFRQPRGCRLCRDRGYVGRLPLHELLVWSGELADALMAEASENELLEIARSQGFRPMLADGANKARAGLTTIEEVLTAVRS